MAGLALHGDLVGPLAGNQPIQLSHRLESVRILPPPDLPDNDPHSYGPITQSAILLAQINNPDRDRVFCMAVTNEGRSGSDATAWSAAIDQAAAGAETDELQIRRPGGSYCFLRAIFPTIRSQRKSQIPMPSRLRTRPRRGTR